MATVNIFLDLRKSKIEDLGIVKLIITHNRVQKMYSTNIKANRDVFNKVKVNGFELSGTIKNNDVKSLHKLLFAEKNIHNESINIKDKVYIDGYVFRAKQVINQLGNNFTFEEFKERFENYDKKKVDATSKDDLIQYLKDKSDKLLKNEQISHGNTFALIAKSLTRFVEYLQKEDPNRLLPKKDFKLLFKHVDSEFLTDWEFFMKKYGKVSQKKINGLPSNTYPATITTISIYARALRTAFNEAISENVIGSELYPFGKYKYKIPIAPTKPKSIDSKLINLIKDYQPIEGTLEQRSLDLFLFSYFGNGMNFSDILSLKWQDIQGDYILFTRNKTKKSETAKMIRVKINQSIKETIERWGNKLKNSNDYVFPYLNGLNTVREKKQAIHQVIKVTNKYTKLIGEKLGVELNLTTYVARHTFANRMMNNSADTNLIKEMLGHAKISTTEAYLGSFENDIVQGFLDRL